VQKLRPEPQKREPMFLVHAELFGDSVPARYHMPVTAANAKEALKRFKDRQSIPDEGHHVVAVYAKEEDFAQNKKPLAQWLSREAREKLKRMD